MIQAAIIPTANTDTTGFPQNREVDLAN